MSNIKQGKQGKQGKQVNQVSAQKGIIGNQTKKDNRVFRLMPTSEQMSVSATRLGHNLMNKRYLAGLVGALNRNMVKPRHPPNNWNTMTPVEKERLGLKLLTDNSSRPIMQYASSVVNQAERNRTIGQRFSNAFATKKNKLRSWETKALNTIKKTRATAVQNYIKAVEAKARNTDFTTFLSTDSNA